MVHQPPYLEDPACRASHRCLLLERECSPPPPHSLEPHPTCRSPRLPRPAPSLTLGADGHRHHHDQKSQKRLYSWKQEIPSSGGRDARVLHLPVLLVYLLPRPLGSRSGPSCEQYSRYDRLLPLVQRWYVAFLPACFLCAEIYISGAIGATTGLRHHNGYCSASASNVSDCSGVLRVRHFIIGFHDVRSLTLASRASKHSVSLSSASTSSTSVSSPLSSQGTVAGPPSRTTCPSLVRRIPIWRRLLPTKQSIKPHGLNRFVRA